MAYTSGSKSSITLRITAVFFFLFFFLVFFLIFIAVLYFFYELYKDDLYIPTSATNDGGVGGSDNNSTKETCYPSNEIKLTEGSKTETENDKEDINPDDWDRSTVVGLQVAVAVNYL